MHDHGHHHGHHHGHAHSQGVDPDGKRLSNIGKVFFLNLAFALIEVVGGLWTGSVAIVADSLHDLGDCLSLGLAYILQRKSQQNSDSSYSYGYGRVSLIAAAITAIVLITGSVAILAHAVPRLMNPVQPRVEGMLGLAVLGVVVNGYMAWKIQRGSTLNERMLSWHLVEDVLGWAVTLIVSIIMYFVDLPILDPILSIVFTLFIMRGVLKTFGETMKLFLQGVPSSIDAAALTSNLLKIHGVKGVHDVHAWSLDGENHVMTLHVVVDAKADFDEILKLKQNVRDKIKSLGRIHTTIEVESEQDECPDLDCVKH